MEKLKLHTPDLTAENIEKLTALFPNCVTEVRDEHGKLTRAVDFDQLRQELSTSIVEGPFFQSFAKVQSLSAQIF